MQSSRLADTAHFSRMEGHGNNEAIGDWENTSDLAASARWGRTFLAASSRRTRPDLDRLTTREVFHLLCGRYIGLQARPPGPWDRNPYLLDEVGEASVRDHASILIVRRGDGWDRVICRRHLDDSLKEIALEPGLCDEIVDAYCSWVEQLPASRSDPGS